MKMNVENIPKPDMIHLHKKTRDILFSDPLKDTLRLSNYHTTKNKMENQMREEKVDNKAHQTQIKKL